MKAYRSLFVFTIAIACGCFQFVLTSDAQRGMSMAPPEISGVWSPVVGTGAEYEVTNKDKKSAMEVTIVGKEAVNGVDAYWMEMGVNDPKTNQRMYMKMLISNAQDSVSTVRFIVQVPGQPNPMDMTTIMPATARQPKAADFRSKGTQVGSETVTVPAGTFVCQHWKSSDGENDAWLSDKVSPWGMVKYSGKDSSMVLLRTISDAKDHITGKPMSLDQMMHH